MNKETLALAIEKCAADDPHVSYDRLSVESDKGCHCGEEVKYLLHDSQTAENMFGTSKFNAQPGPGGSVTVTIEVEGDPVQLVSYAIKSANDAPGRDPCVW